MHLSRVLYGSSIRISPQELSYPRRMVRIALLGCGNIGRIIATRADGIEIAAVYDADSSRTKELAAITGARACADFSALLASEFDTLVEAASIDAVRQFAQSTLESGHNLVVLSVGALADPELRTRLELEAERHDVRIHIPSGAIIGLDNLKVAAISRMTRLILITTKPAVALGVDVSVKTCQFRGSASDCIARFPRNVNVAVALSLATGREPEVELWADPVASTNTHLIIAEGEFGRAELKTDNLPCPDNPRTSYLAALSVLTLLRNLDCRLTVGT